MSAIESSGILGVFTTLDAVGGIEESGRLAWETLKKGSGERTFLLCYRNQASKLQTVREALGRRWPVKTVMFWHLGLLKLLPFLRISNPKLVLFLHGIECWKRQDAFTRHLLRRVDLFLSNTSHTWETFVHANPEFRNAVHRTVHLGTGRPFNATTPPPPCAPTALMIGRMSRSEGYKGHAEVIRTWPAVLAHIPAARLWIAGSGDLAGELEQLASALGISRAVTFFGAVSEETKDQLLRSASCLALPSRGEGFGLVYLEAMRLGRPCLVSNMDAGREVVQPPQAGLAVDPGNGSELCSALIRLLTPGTEWDHWSRQARDRFEANFTAASFQSRLACALQSL